MFDFQQNMTSCRWLFWPDLGLFCSGLAFLPSISVTFLCAGSRGAKQWKCGGGEKTTEMWRSERKERGYVKH